MSGVGAAKSIVILTPYPRCPQRIWLRSHTRHAISSSITFWLRSFGIVCLSGGWWSGEYVVAESVADAHVAGALSAAASDQWHAAHGGVDSGGVGPVGRGDEVGADQLGGGLFLGAGCVGPTLRYRQPADFGGRGQTCRRRRHGGRVPRPTTGPKGGKLRRRDKGTCRAGRRSQQAGRVERLLPNAPPEVCDTDPEIGRQGLFKDCGVLTGGKPDPVVGRGR